MAWPSHWGFPLRSWSDERPRSSRIPAFHTRTWLSALHLCDLLAGEVVRAAIEREPARIFIAKPFHVWYARIDRDTSTEYFVLNFQAFPHPGYV